jgi:hypothetical protein
LGDPIVNPHEVGVFSELGDDFSCVNPQSLMCYRGERHEALLGSGVHLVGDLIQSLGEVPDGESLSKTFAPFISLPIAVTLGILVVSVFISGCIGGHLIF